MMEMSYLRGSYGVIRWEGESTESRMKYVTWELVQME